MPSPRDHDPDPAPQTRQPMLATGVVRHTRLRPARHAFSYPVLYLLLPLRAMAASAAAADHAPTPMLQLNRRGVLSVHDSDHGDGGPMLRWIDALLHTHGIDDANGEVWLQTFPRVLGFVFNPVSFWFCERADGQVRAVVAEVNNTFGERHCYLLAHDDGRPLRNGEELRATKVFHVSPFCEVDGGYRFRFFHRPSERSLMRIDYDAPTPLLQTSVSGRHQPATQQALRWAWLRQPMFTLGVVARIHWQALKLWRKRVPFFSKPQPPHQFVTR